MKLKIFFCVILYFWINYSIAQSQSNILNETAQVIGMEKQKIKDVCKIASIKLLKDDSIETVFSLGDGSFWIFHFDQQDIAIDGNVKLTKGNHSNDMQTLINESDWVYKINSEKGNCKLYKNSNFPLLSGVLLKETNATYFSVLK